MGMYYRILDYKNGKIISNLTKNDVLVSLRALFPLYTTSFAVVTHNDEFVTQDFKETSDGWSYEPCPKLLAKGAN